MTQTAIDFEPIFGIYIDFSDGSQPINMSNLNLASAAKVLQEWSENWILQPDITSHLTDTIWVWHARPRKNKPIKDKSTETYAEILDPDYIPEVIQDG